MISVTDTQKAGIGILGFGMTFLFLGVFLFFDRGLLAMGNLLFILGLALVNGMTRFLRLVIQPQRWYGSLGFILGIALVLSGYCIIGMAAEIAGFTFLFWDFVPTAVGYLQRTPLLGYLMELSGINQVLERITPTRRRKLSEG